MLEEKVGAKQAQTSSYEPFSQALKSFDYVPSGSKGKIF